LETLARFDARATFFTIGRNLDAQLDIGRRIAAEGHELGNHSWRHVYWQNFFGRRTHGAEIDRTTALIQRLTNSSVEPLYRPPVGLKSPELAHAAVARQLRIVAWSIHSRDTMLKDPQRIASRVLATIAPGDIVLLHDGHDLPGRHRHAGASALPLILQGLKERQLAAVTVSELIDE
jgi:peptidoglycan/xylan/chitin deacetylase (PgdA/CDA1 family)